MSISLSCVFGKSKNTLLESLKLFFFIYCCRRFFNAETSKQSFKNLFCAPNYFPKNFNDVGDVGKPGGVTFRKSMLKLMDMMLAQGKLRVLWRSDYE